MENKTTSSIVEIIGGLLIGLVFILPLQLALARSNIGSGILFWVIEIGAYLSVVVFSFLKWRHQKVYIGVIIGGILAFALFFLGLYIFINNIEYPDNYYPYGF